MAAFQRLYTYLSQIFDYGNTAVEKRAIFFRQVLRLLEFGREREGIDLSKVVLTHHTLKNRGKQPMPLSNGETPKLEPITEAGSGIVQEKQKALLNEIIQRVNDLFEGDLTDQDKLVYVSDVIKGKLVESQKLVVQAANNTKEQFANSPDLKSEILNAVMSALEAHTAMSAQALSSETVRDGLKDVLLVRRGFTKRFAKGQPSGTHLNTNGQPDNSTGSRSRRSPRTGTGALTFKRLVKKERRALAAVDFCD